MIKALIFDFDGLILDTETAWFHAYKTVLKEEYDYELSLDDFVKCVGADDTVLFAILEEKIHNNISRVDIRNKAREIHSEVLKTLGVREGIVTYLKESKEKGLINAICTSSKQSWIDYHLKNLGLYAYFDYFITQDDVEKIKPDPELFNKTLDVLQLEAHEAIVFEDSLNGLISAQGANIPVVIVPNTVTNQLPFDNYLLKVDSLGDISLDEVLEKAKATQGI